MPGSEEDGLFEHDIGQPHADEGAHDLRGDINGHVPPGEASLARVGEGHGRIEMGARDRPERQDESDEPRTGRDGVREQGQGDVPAGKLVSHDAGTNHGRQEQSRSDPLGNGSACEIRA